MTPDDDGFMTDGNAWEKHLNEDKAFQKAFKIPPGGWKPWTPMASETPKQLKTLAEVAEEYKMDVRAAWDRLCTPEYPDGEVYLRSFGRGIAARTISLPPSNDCQCENCAKGRIKILWSGNPGLETKEWLLPLLIDWLKEINQNSAEKYDTEIRAYVMGVPYRFAPGKKPRKLPKC